jgi:hypothetical protein
MKHILKLLTLLTIFGCSSKNDNDEINTEAVSVLTITNSSIVSNTPFSKPREAIIFENNLYAVNDINTYKYDFSSNVWEVINTNSVGVAIYPIGEYNVSFIRNNKWNIINHNAL